MNPVLNHTLNNNFFSLTMQKVIQVLQIFVALFQIFTGLIFIASISSDIQFGFGFILLTLGAKNLLDMFKKK